MTNQEILILIKGKDESDKVFKVVRENMKATEKSAGTLGGGIASLKSSWLAMTAATAGFVMFAEKAIDEFMKQEEAEHALAGAMLNVGDYTKAAHAELVRYAEQLQQTTVFADDVTLATMANLKAYGMNNEELKKAVQATLDLASAKRMDLWAASELVGKAFVGETGTLARYGIVIDDNISRGEKFAAVLKTINERFGGRAAMEIETYAGQWKVLKNTWSDILETVGYALLKALEALTGQLALDVAMFQKLISTIAGGLATVYDLMSLLPGKTGDFFEGMTMGADATAKKFDDLAKSSWDFGMKHFDMITKGQKEIDEALNSHVQKVHIVTAEEQKALDDYTKMHQDAVDKVEKATLDETTYKIYKLNEWYSAAVDVYDKAGKDTTELFQSWSIQRIAILEEEKKKTEETVDYGVEAAKQAAQNMQNAFSTFFLDAMTGKLRSFKDYVLGLFQAMATSVSNIMSQMLVNALMGTQTKSGGWAGGLLEGIGDLVTNLISPSAGYIPGAWGAEGGVFPGTWRPLKAFGSGGVVDRPMLGMIGEGGSPEAVVPLSDGRYIPVKMAGGGMSIQVNIINKGSQEQKGMANVQFDGKAYIINVILEDLAQGGPLRGAMNNMKG
jgi:hypothetical protein